MQSGENTMKNIADWGLAILGVAWLAACVWWPDIKKLATKGNTPTKTLRLKEDGSVERTENKQ
jgi:hypothetical protein